MENVTSILVFDGSPKKLKYTLSAARLFRAVAGMPVWKVRLPDDDGLVRILDSEILTKVLWAGLLHENKDLTIEQAEELLEKFIKADIDNSLVTVYKAITVAFDESGLFGLKKTQGEEVVPSPNE